MLFCWVGMGFCDKKARYRDDEVRDKSIGRNEAPSAGRAPERTQQPTPSLFSRIRHNVSKKSRCVVVVNGQRPRSCPRVISRDNLQFTIYIYFVPQTASHHLEHVSEVRDAVKVEGLGGLLGVSHDAEGELGVEAARRDGVPRLQVKPNLLGRLSHNQSGASSRFGAPYDKQRHKFSPNGQVGEARDK